MYLLYYEKNLHITTIWLVSDFRELPIPPFMPYGPNGHHLWRKLDWLHLLFQVWMIDSICLSCCVISWWYNTVNKWYNIVANVLPYMYNKFGLSHMLLWMKLKQFIVNLFILLSTSCWVKLQWSFGVIYPSQKV